MGRQDLINRVFSYQTYGGYLDHGAPSFAPLSLRNANSNHDVPWSGEVATSTRLSKKVAAAPKSVKRVLVVVLQLTPSRVNLFHQMPWLTITPDLTFSATTARASKAPRSLKTRTH